MIREHAGPQRPAKTLDTRKSLFDLVVHSQDIAVPVGRDLPVPPASAAPAWSRSGKWDGRSTPGEDWPTAP